MVTCSQASTESASRERSTSRKKVGATTIGGSAVCKIESSASASVSESRPFVVAKNASSLPSTSHFVSGAERDRTVGLLNAISDATLIPPANSLRLDPNDRGSRCRHLKIPLGSIPANGTVLTSPSRVAQSGIPRSDEASPDAHDSPTSTLEFAASGGVIRSEQRPLDRSASSQGVRAIDQGMGIPLRRPMVRVLARERRHGPLCGWSEVVPRPKRRRHKPPRGRETDVFHSQSRRVGGRDQVQEPRTALVRPARFHLRRRRRRARRLLLDGSSLDERLIGRPVSNLGSATAATARPQTTNA